MNFRKEISKYWKCSINNDFNNFDFFPFFFDFLIILEDKLALHGQLSLEKYIEHLSMYYDFKSLGEFVYESKRTNQSYDIKKIKELIFKPRYEEFKKSYIDDFFYIKLLKLYKDLKKSKFDNLEKNIILMERCISAEHCSGRLIGLDIDKMRKIFENKLNQLCHDEIFGILTRNGLNEKIREINKPFDFIFIDFNDLHLLNEKFGYEKVNRDIKELFEKFNRKHVIGRYFSGDEIVIITNNPYNIIKRLLIESPFPFKYEIYEQQQNLDILKK